MKGTPMHTQFTCIHRHQTPLFFALSLVLSWVAFVPFYNSGGESIPWFTFGPAVAAILITALASGWRGIRDLLAAAVRWRVGAIWYGVALGLPFGAQLASVLLNPVVGSAEPDWNAIPPAGQMLPMILIYAVFSGPVGEEIGWRGFALPRLLARYSALTASLILGAVWAVWHLPLILVDDFTAYGALMPVIAAIVFTWVFQNSSGSVLLAILMHISHQNSVRYLGRVYNDADQVQQQWIGVVIWALTVAMILVFNGTRSFLARSAPAVRETEMQHPAGDDHL
ncbi:MAG: type II CAAX endopeptidase family protein [Cypionkella sp.]|uniref:CPBP family intramembrane glutamic endopeptidase n=1 Tax=Cypionkella sp. TaxID=2811411 RepID=UPI002ABCE7E3|nr:type II CAAX endopeptidase family protein [Cypionkella sp.]MDZ4312732.1 type II CAAX endopeptidase family protein [Cypionkella sp.]